MGEGGKKLTQLEHRYADRAPGFAEGGGHRLTVSPRKKERTERGRKKATKKRLNSSVKGGEKKNFVEIRSNCGGPKRFPSGRDV